MLMNHLLLLTNSNVTECMKRSMRSVKQNISASYLDGAKNKSPYNSGNALEVLESKLNLTLNKIKKRKEINPTKNHLNSNNLYHLTGEMYYR